MNFTITLISKLSSMMLMAAAGWLIVKIGVFPGEGIRPLSNLVVYLVTPCLILNSFQIEMTSERIEGFFSAVLFSSLAFLIWILLAHLLKKPFHLSAIEEATLIYPNVGNLILPLVEMTLGTEMVFYATAIQIPFNLFVWTHGISVISGQNQFRLKKIVTNPYIIAVALGLVMMFTGVTLPDFPGTAVSGLAATVGPLSMMVIGMTIAGTSLKEVFTFKKAYTISLARLIVFPLIILLLLKVTGFPWQHTGLVPVFMVTFMSLAAPPAATVSQLAIVYDREPVEASIYNIIGVILCIVTLPLMVTLYRMMFPA